MKDPHQPEAVAEFLGPFMVDFYFKGAGFILDFTEMGVDVRWLIF